MDFNMFSDPAVYFAARARRHWLSTRRRFGVSSAVSLSQEHNKTQGDVKAGTIPYEDERRRREKKKTELDWQNLAEFKLRAEK